MTRQYNRQFGPVGFKVSIQPDADGLRQYQLYCWDWQRSREVLLSGGLVRGSIEHVQAVARREAAALNATTPTHGLHEEPGESRAGTMHKKPNQKPTQRPRLINIRDCRGDDLTPPRLAQELIDNDRATIRAERDWQASREGLDAEIPAMPDYSPRPFGRIAAVIFLLIAAFIAGLAMGKLV